MWDPAAWNLYSTGMFVVLACAVIAFLALARERDDLHRLLLIDLVEIPSLGIIALLGTDLAEALVLPGLVVGIAELLAANGLDGLAARISSRRLRGIGAAVLGLLIPAAAAANYIGLVGPLRATRGPEYEEARRLDACVPAQDMILARWGVQQNLAFHFNRRFLLEADIAPLVFCRNLNLPRDYRAVSETSVTLPMDFLNPGVTPFPFNGYGRPEAWKRYLGWLLDFKSREAGDSASCRSFEALPCDRVAYLRISLDRIPLAGWSDLLDRLEGTFDVQLGKRGLYREWRCVSESQGRGEAP